MKKSWKMMLFGRWLKGRRLTILLPCLLALMGPILVLSAADQARSAPSSEAKPIDEKPIIKDPMKADPIHDAAANGDIMRIPVLLQNNPENLNKRDPDGWTPLIYAARFGRLDAVKFLIEKKADIEAADVHGFRALHQAAQSDQVEVIEALLNAGAKVYARTTGSVTPRRLASSNGARRSEKLLADRGGVK